MQAAQKILNENYAFEIVEEVLKEKDLYQGIQRDFRNGKIKTLSRKHDIIMQVLETMDTSIARLGPKEKKFIELKYCQGKDNKTVAQRLKISIRTVANWRTKILMTVANGAALI